MCTGILLKSQKNDVVRARTLEWSAFDFDTHLCIYPRKFEFNKTKSQNTTDYKWQAKYGFVAMIGAKDYNFAIDGINEKGLGIGGILSSWLC
jgi:choloylglycine hydrolase